MSVSTAPTGYPPGWKCDYDGETERWFYIHTPTGVRQYHFPKDGDETELAAALTKSKSDREAKLQEANKAAAASKNSAEAILSSTSASQAAVGVSKQQQSFPGQTRIAAQISNAQQQNTFSASNPKPITAQSHTGFPIQQQLIRQGATSVPPPGIRQQNTQKTTYQAFVPIRLQPHIQQQNRQSIGYQPFVPNQQQQQYKQGASQTLVHPSNPEHQILSTTSRQHPVMTEQPMSHNATPHPVNQSSPASIPDRPQSIDSPEGSVSNPAGENRSYYSETTSGSPISYAELPPAIPSADFKPQDVVVAPHPKQEIQQNNSTPARYNSVDDVISARIRILSLPDHDRESLTRNLLSLARIYPDVTFLQFVDPSIDLPPPTQIHVPPPPSTHGPSRRASESVINHHHETGMDSSSSISRDGRVPTIRASQYGGSVYSLVAPSPERLLPHQPRRTLTSPAELADSVSTPSSGSALDLHSNYTAATSMDSPHDNQSNIQAPLGMSQAPRPNLNQERALSGQTSHTLPRGMENVSVIDAPATTSQDTHVPSLSSGMPIADKPLNQDQKAHQSPMHVQSSHVMTGNIVSHPPSQATRPRINGRTSWEKTIHEGRELREQSATLVELPGEAAPPPVSAKPLRQGSIPRKPLMKQISSQSVPQQQPSSQPVIECLEPQNHPQSLLKTSEPKSLAAILPHSSPIGGSTRRFSAQSVASQLTISSQEDSLSRPASLHDFGSQILSNQSRQRHQYSPPIRLQTPFLQSEQSLTQQHPSSHEVLKDTSEISSLLPQQIHASIGIPTQQPSQVEAESGRREVDRLSQIIKQNEQLLLLYQQNLQNLQNLQILETTNPTPQNGQRPQSPFRGEIAQQINNQIGVSFNHVRSAPNLPDV